MTGSCALTCPPCGNENGFILMPVVLAIVIIATIAFMLNNQSSINVGETGSMLQAEQAEQLVQAGLAHTTWQVQNSQCSGDMVVPATTFGPGSYSATVDAAGVATTHYSFTPDRDSWIDSSSPDINNGSAASLSVTNKANKTDQALYHYDLSSIPAGKKVLTAIAWFYVEKPDDVSALSLHPVTADWTEAAVTWNSFAEQYESVTYGSIPVQSATNVWVAVNVTALAQSWVNNPGTNYGFLLHATNDTRDSKYSSREASANLRPYLQITTGDSAIPPLNITVKGVVTGNPSPGNDITRTLVQANMPALQPGSDTVLQPGTNGVDAYVYESQPSWNYGASSVIRVENRTAGAIATGLLKFDLASIPYGASVIAAQLELYQTDNSLGGGSIGIHRINDAWSEGASDGATGSASWTERDAGVSWSVPGGDYDAMASATTNVSAGKGWSAWNITGLVDNWIAGDFDNNGFAIVAEVFGTAALFASSDDADPSLRPRLSITYACECGSPCLALQNSGSILMVVGNAASLSSADATKKAIFESWGYTVNVQDDNASATALEVLASSIDVLFVSESVAAGTIASKLTELSTGVVSALGELNDELGIAAGSTNVVGRSINVTDTSHYITEMFPAGALQIYSADMEGVTVSGSEAPGLQTLADWSGAASLAVLDSGAAENQTGAYSGDGTASGRRVMLPTGRLGGIDWKYLNNNGMLLVQRALQWSISVASVVPAMKIYWTDDQGGKIQRADPDGSHIEDVMTGLDAPTGLDIDTVNGKLYWTTGGRDIKRADLDGSNVETIYHSPSGSVFDLKLDLVGNKVYFTRDQAGVLHRMNLDGSVLQTVTTAASQPAYISLDTAGSYVYLTDFGSGRVARVRMNGSGYTVLRNGLGTPVGNALDLDNGKLYWSDGAAGDKVHRMNLDGSSAEVIATGLSAPQDIDVDSAAGRVYWTNAWNRNVKAADLDGANTVDVATGLVRPRAIVVVSADLVPPTGGGGGGESGGPSPTDGVVFEEYSEAQLGSNGKSFSIAKPGGVAAGDLLIAAVATDGRQESAMSAPAGWTLINHGDQSESVTLDVWWKIAGAAEPASYDFSWAEDQQAYGMVMRFTGHDATNPVNAVSSTGGYSNSPVSPAVTTTVADAMILRIGGFDDDDITVDDPGLAGHTAIAMNESRSGLGTVSAGAGYVTQVSSGDSGISSFSLNAAEQYRTVTIGIAPAP